MKRFPVDDLKIDRSSVDGLGVDADDHAIVTAVVSMAHAMGLGVIAEGVETRCQLQELRRLGCDSAQGYLIGRPQSAHETGRRWVAPRTSITVRRNRPSRVGAVGARAGH
ncbi:MAG: EAL domain-containing protein [Acidimicrobiales bacterium]